MDQTTMDVSRRFADLGDYFTNLPPAEQQRIAEDARTTASYLRKNVFTKRTAHMRMPSLDMISRLTGAFDQHFNRPDLGLRLLNDEIDASKLVFVYFSARMDLLKQVKEREGDRRVLTTGRDGDQTDNQATSHRPKCARLSSASAKRKDQFQKDACGVNHAK